MADTWAILDDRTEQELHKTRLLNVEERPFKRITKRLQQLSTILTPSISAREIPAQKRAISFLREDLTTDFSIFDASLSRIQFLFNANALERARYDTDKKDILDKCQAVREQNALLRQDLEQARETLAKRKRFDDLADRITANRLLRPREDQRAALKKLEDECAELERERETYAETWRERKGQFNRIMNEGMELRRQIRDEAEEVDRRQGMNDDDDEGTDGTPAVASSTPAPAGSRGSTPRPDGKEEDETGDSKKLPGSNLRSELALSRSRSTSRLSTLDDASLNQLTADLEEGDDDSAEEEEGVQSDDGDEEGGEVDDDGEINEEAEDVEMVVEPVQVQRERRATRRSYRQHRRMR